MSKPRRTRWVCPECDDGVLGPQRPRRDNIVRYCLPCSEKAGKLVERSTPSLDKRREARAEKNAERRAAKAKREREREKRRTHISLTDAAGRVVELDVAKTVRAFAKRAGVPCGFQFSWNRRSDGGNSGRANRYTVHLSIGSGKLESFCSLAAHELAHVSVGGREGWHNDKWRDEYERICAVLWDTKPVFRLGVQHHRYAIDPEIKAQLVATSRGEYKRSKAKLPLAGRLIDQ